MKILIAKHFWEKGHYAKWRYHTDFPKDVFHWLQENYSSHLVAEQPNWLVFEKGILFFCYQHKQEANNRPITELTAFWLPKSSHDPSRIYEQLNCEGIKNNNALEITINIGQWELLHKIFQPWFILLSLLLLVAVIMGENFLVGESLTFEPQKDNTSASTEPILTSEKQTDKKLSPVSTENMQDQNLKKPKDEPCDEYKQLKRFKYCYQAFLSERCSDNSSMNFDEWLKNLKSNRITEFYALGCYPSVSEELSQDEGIQILSEEKKQAVIKLLKNTGN